MPNYGMPAYNDGGRRRSDDHLWSGQPQQQQGRSAPAVANMGSGKETNLPRSAAPMPLHEVLAVLSVLLDA